MNTNLEKEGGKTKLRYRLLCMKEKQNELRERIQSILDQRQSCCFGLTLNDEPLFLNGEQLLLNSEI